MRDDRSDILESSEPDNTSDDSYHPPPKNRTHSDDSYDQQDILPSSQDPDINPHVEDRRVLTESRIAPPSAKPFATPSTKPSAPPDDDASAFSSSSTDLEILPNKPQKTSTYDNNEHNYQFTNNSDSDFGGEYSPLSDDDNDGNDDDENHIEYYDTLTSDASIPDVTNLDNESDSAKSRDSDENSIASENSDDRDAIVNDDVNIFNNNNIEQYNPDSDNNDTSQSSNSDSYSDIYSGNYFIFYIYDYIVM